MKNSIKRIVCVLFSLFVLVGAMSACGSKKDTTSDNSSASSNKGGSSGASTVSITKASDTTGDYGENFNPYASIPDSIKGSTVRFATWIDHTQTEGAVPLSNFERDTGLKVELFTVSQS